MNETKHCGYVAIIGRPNVGKSTLLNHIITKKVSITSSKPQTTRYKILGIKTVENYQYIYVDTPGLHSVEKGALNRRLNKTATDVISDVDVIVFVVAGSYWKDEDEMVLEKLSKATCPVILAINKVDLVEDKNILLPHIQKLNTKMNFAKVVPISAKNGTNVAELEEQIKQLLPVSPFFFDVDQVTDRNAQFIAAELVREKLMRYLGDELPYATAVSIEQFMPKPNVLVISAIIFVEKPGQKLIVIGVNGSVLKKIGSAARQDLEKQFGQKVFLRLWVKVKSNWIDSDNL